MLVDLSQIKQSYIEDCEVCCNPIQIQLQIDNQLIISFLALNIEQ